MFLVLSFFLIKPLFLAIFVGGLLAYLFSPFYQVILSRTKGGERQKITTALIICGVVLLLLIIPGIYFLKVLVKQSYTLLLLGKEKLTVGLFDDCTNQFCQSIQKIFQNEQVLYHVQESLKLVTNWVIKKSSEFLLSLPVMFLNIFVTFFTMFYFLKEGEVLEKKMAHFFGASEESYHFIVKRLKEITRGLIYGYLIIALIQGALGALGFFLFGVSSPLFWGLIMTFLALIPMLGTGIVWLPAVVILVLEGLFQGNQFLIVKGIGLFLYSFIIVSGVDNLLKPKLVSNKAKVHPAIIVVGIFGGLFFFGAWGVLLGPLILSLTSVLIDVFVFKKL